MPKKLTLMVVTDDRNHLDLLYRTLRRQFQVFRAESESSALHILKCEGEMAIIMADQSMPDLSGIELLSKVKDMFPNTIMILFTGYDSDLQDIPEGVVFKCVQKPWSPEELNDVVQEAAEMYKDAKGS